MMPDMQKVMQTKNRILQLIQEKGPELPVRVASAIGQNNLFTAAFMSELVGEQKLKISNMKVGGSPLYYLSGQEEQLQKYSEYLNNKEKEAFKMLKENEILSDINQEPAIRVALRNLRDFAFPVKIVDKEEEKIFWKFHTLTNEKARELIENILNPKPKKEEKETNQEIEKPQAKIQSIKNTKNEETLNLFEKQPSKKEAKKITKQITSDFLNNIKTHLSNKKIEIINEISTKKKELIAKIKLNTEFGEQEIYLVAKNKKKITLEDLINVIQKTQLEKMPALILSPGDIDKKAQDYYKQWSNLIKHQKVNL